MGVRPSVAGRGYLEADAAEVGDQIPIDREKEEVCT